MALGDCHLSSCSLCPGLVLGAVLAVLGASEVPGPVRVSSDRRSRSWDYQGWSSELQRSQDRGAAEYL
jgi:hypothetical protein